MEKGELKTGQLLGIIEKNGKLVQEYVAGFFGDEPIIKQRLLTPQEARRHREDQTRGKRQGQPVSGAALVAGRIKTGPALAGQPGLKKRPVAPGTPARMRPVATETASAGTAADQSLLPQVRTRPARTAEQTPAVPEAAAYTAVSGSGNESYLKNLIDGEPDKTNFNPANKQKALKTISQIGSPEMRVYRIGKKSGEAVGMFHSQKEYLAREILGLPLWKVKAEKPAAMAEVSAVHDSEPDLPDNGTSSVTADVNVATGEEVAASGDSTL
jgi:hypothetical protein